LNESYIEIPAFARIQGKFKIKQRTSFNAS